MSFVYPNRCKVVFAAWKTIWRFFSLDSFSESRLRIFFRLGLGLIWLDLIWLDLDFNPNLMALRGLVFVRITDGEINERRL